MPQSDQVLGHCAGELAFGGEPQTNGNVERFNRTLKEQTIHGRVFRNLEEVRNAVTAFKDRYNRHWRLEKMGFMSPLEARSGLPTKRPPELKNRVQKMRAG
ncbi:MAG: transposase, partial [Sphingomonadales bacterium]|nr:transposase [Sphingomonadales bacterium]